MANSKARAAYAAALAVVATIAAFGQGLQAQMYSNSSYYPVPWPKPWSPDGANGSIDFGPTTAMFADPNTDHIWIATRCGRTPNYHTSEEGCVFKPDYNMVFKFDLDGNLVARFGAGTLGGPHSMYVDRQGNVYVADEGGGAEFGHTGAEVDAEAARIGINHQVVKYSPTGQVLMRFGTPGVPGTDSAHLTSPSSVGVAPDGSVFIGDSHGGGTNRRIMKFSPTGQFIKQVGCSDCGDERVANSAWGRFSDVHAMAFDSQGRLFAADKGNWRVQIFDQDLNFLDVWTQFGAPAGIAIMEGTDLLVTADAESHNSPPMDGSPSNTGWQQGLYIGSARTGWVKDFVLALAPPISGGDGGPEGVAVDRYGNIYWGETRSALDIRRGQHVMKYVDITRTPHATCEWWGYESQRTGRTGPNQNPMTGCGIDDASRMDP
jgi:DNA-binding beta-propeller fold protein YncE